MHTRQKIIYYTDELNDEFAGDAIEPKHIDGEYPYIRRSIGQRIAHVFWYRIIATPLAAIYMKLHFHHRIVNGKVLKENAKSGYFMYGNHTHNVADALNPTMVNFPKEVAVIVHPNNVSMPVLGNITPYLGALPLPDDMDAAKHFMNAIKYHIQQKHCIMIYPEAHIWPFYTDIRPFKDTSFRYPIQYHMPVYCFTNTYQKRRLSRKPNLVTYVDGPFYPNTELSVKEQKKELRDRVYDTMKQRARLSNVQVIKYQRKTKEIEEN